MTAQAISGVCRVCGCTDQAPCIFDTGVVIFPVNPEADLAAPPTCSWMDSGRTLCSNLRCVAAIPLAELVDICFPAKTKLRKAVA